jgi:SAM-dependent methyltransferase
MQPGVATTLGIRLRNTLIRRYSRRGARRYEERRHGARWEAEARAFDRLYAKLAPQRVLDCPAGTGRWFETFHRSGASVVGIDISQNMLDEAARKIPADANFRLRRLDVLDPKSSQALGSGYDLIVCTRFVYWLRPAELTILLTRFRETGAPHLLAGAKVSIERKRGADSKGLWRFLDRARHRFYRQAIKRLYKEPALLDIFAANGWQVAERVPIVTTRSMQYFYYLFSSPSDQGVSRQPAQVREDR